MALFGRIRAWNYSASDLDLVDHLFGRDNVAARFVAALFVGKYRAAPFRDDETVYDGERVVQAGHVTFLEQFRERCVGWRPNLCRPSAAIDLIKVT